MLFQMLVYLSCFWKSKIQILKAIHNYYNATQAIFRLFLKVKDTNFESNSQHLAAKQVQACAVSESQRYKFWKQFTTFWGKLQKRIGLFLKVKDTNFESNSQLASQQLYSCKSCFWKSKIQILKAIHNSDIVIFVS